MPSKGPAVFQGEKGLALIKYWTSCEIGMTGIYCGVRVYGM